MDASEACISLAFFSGAALQAAAFYVEDLEGQRGGAIVFKMDREGTPCSADPGDLGS